MATCCFFASCTKKDKSAQPNKEAKQILQEKRTEDVPTQNLEEIKITTLWLSQFYLERLGQSRSHASSLRKEGISYIYPINDEKLNVVKGFYSGYVYNQQKRGRNILLIGSDSIEITVDKQNLLVEDEKLTRTDIVDPNYIVESILFAGDFSIGDKAGIKIGKNGQITNWDRYTQLNIDYGLAYDEGIDALSLYGPDGSDRFLYQFINDSLVLYGLECIYDQTDPSACFKAGNIINILVAND